LWVISFLLFEWRQRLIIILEAQDSLYKAWNVIVYLQDRVEIASITNVLKATWLILFPFSLLWVEWFLSNLVNTISLSQHRLHDGLIEHLIFIADSSDVLWIRLVLHACLKGSCHLLVRAISNQNSLLTHVLTKLIQGFTYVICVFPDWFEGAAAA